jgi:hypothetical protein
MELTANECRAIMAALRYTCEAQEEIAKMYLQKGDRVAAMRHGGFAAYCGELSDKLEKQGLKPSMIRTN